MRIDVHAHLYPEVYLDTLERFGGVAGESFVRQLRGGASRDEMLERLIMMDRAQVDMQILSVSASVPYFEDRQKAVAAARCANDAYAETAGRYPGRFAAFASLPLPHLDAAIAELGRALDELACVGATITTEVLGTAIANGRFDPLFTELNRRDAVLFIHPAGTGLHSAPVQNGGFTWSIGAPFEDLLCVMQMACAGIPERFPRIRVICAHLGGCLPFLMDRLSHHSGLPVSRGPQPATVSREQAAWFFYDTVNGHPPALKCACETIGSSRLLMGTDMPYNRGVGYQRMVDSIAQAGLTDDDTDAIWGRNATRLLGTRPSPAAV